MFLSMAIGMIALILTVILMGKEVNIGLILLLDAFFVVLATKMDLVVALKAALSGALSERCLETISILFLIMMLERTMRDEKMLVSMAQSLKGLVRNEKLVVYLMPAMIGMLPSPGGARFSSPMVEESAGDKTDPETKAFINYWFRHVWQDCFVLYPSAIAAAKILNLNVLQVSLPVMGIGVFYTLIGYIMTRNKIHVDIKIRTSTAAEDRTLFLKSIFPVVQVIALYMLFSLLKIPFDLEIASIITILTLFAVRKISNKQIMTIMKSSVQVKYVIIILGVMIFMEVFTQSGLVKELLALMTTFHLPKEVFFILLPMIGGFASGLTLSAVSLAFPILAPLGLTTSLVYVACAYVCGVIGNMVTPLHLCGVMSSEFFKVKTGKLLFRVMRGELFVLGFIVLILIFMRFAGGV